jgi:hypothetical protein
MSTNSPILDKPAERLASLILDRLVTEHLLSISQAAKLLPKFSAGTMQEEDWRLAIETSIQKEDDK